MRRRIAVLASQIDEANQRKFLEAFIRCAHQSDYDVCIFSPYLKFQLTDLRDIGDTSIFELINFDLFKAVVILSDTILHPGCWEKLEARIKKEFKGPVISVDRESKEFHSIMMDHYSSFRRIVDHMVDYHGYRDIAYLGGKEGHPHSVQRYNAFLDVMKEHDIPVRQEWVCHGNYWYDSAELFAKKLLEDREHFPRAIICANDLMAIGVAAVLSEAGYKIPEDVAISGYDSVADGLNSPLPITSASIPFDDCGEYCFKYIEAELMEEHIDSFVNNTPVIIGGSCGCPCHEELVPKARRKEWKTEQSSLGIYSDFDFMQEDLLGQKRLSDFLSRILENTYQIQPYEAFDLCLNDGFMNPDSFIGEHAIRNGFTDKVNIVISTTRDGGSVNLNRSFKTGVLTPLIWKDRDFPASFVFNPIFADDRVFGYTVIEYRDTDKLYNESFRIWMRNIMHSLEAFYRQGYMFTLLEEIRRSQIRDSLTGLYNYEGFLNAAGTELLGSISAGQKISIVAIDIKGLHQINELYGRNEGEHAIGAVGRAIQGVTQNDVVTCRMCNDEFLIALVDNETSDISTEIVEQIREKLGVQHTFTGAEYELKINSSNLLEEVRDAGELESLVNRSVSLKNFKKFSKKNSVNEAEITDELKRNQDVMDILNRNLLTYYYQPIVNAADGSIYAYEALMRCERPRLSPFHIIQSATYLNRLNDIEKFTLLNVTSDVAERIDMFGGAKIFINSLPGIFLSEADEIEFASRMMNSDGRFVIEFTEDSELTDDQLEAQKRKYRRYGCTIAIDDYGAGYSNVNNLLRYMPQYVKIDRMLISEIQNNPPKQHLVKGIIGFAHDNGIKALAEGVETKEELEECLGLGIDLIQGYYTGRPARDPIGEIAPEIRREIEGFNRQNITWRM